MTFRVLGNSAWALRASTALACGIYSHRAGFYCFLERNSMRDSVQGRVQWVLPLCHATNTWRLTHTGMTVAQICSHFMVKIYKCLLQWYRLNIRFASKVMDIFLNQLITLHWNNTTNLRPNPLMRQEMMGLGCSGNSRTKCKQTTPRFRQITTLTPHHSIYRPDALPDDEPTVSKHRRPSFELLSISCLLNAFRETKHRSKI